MKLPRWITPTRCILFGIIVLGAILRLTAIGSAPLGLYADEATNGNDALQAIESGFQWFYPNNNGREGLFINLQALSLALAGVNEPWVLRIVSALAGILTIPGIYYLGRVLFTKRIGLIAAAFLATSYWHLTFSRIGFRAILAPLILVWAIGLLIRGFALLRETPNKKAWVYMIAGGALVGLGLHTYIAFRASIIAVTGICLAALWHSQLKKKVLLSSVIAGLAALLIAAPLLHYFWQYPEQFSGRSTQVSVFATENTALAVIKNIGLTGRMLFIEGDHNWRHNFSGKPQLTLPVGLSALLGIGLLLWQMRTKRDARFTGVVLGLLLITGALPAVLTTEGMPHALRSILLIPPLMILGAVGAAYLSERIQSRYGYAFGAIVLIALPVYALVDTSTSYTNYLKQPEVRDEFSYSAMKLGYTLREKNYNETIYVVAPHGDALIDGMPVAAQTPMFISNTATKQKQQVLGVAYVRTQEEVPNNATFYILK